MPIDNNNASMTNNYVTQCKICRDGIFKHQPYVWNMNPIGLCHTICVGDTRKDAK
jgi:hypothetical protein